MSENYGYRWVKYRTLHSSGPNPRNGWFWREVEVNLSAPEKQQISDVLYDLDDELNTHSEHWRGVEAHFGTPPKDWLERELESAKKALTRAENRVARLIGQLERTEDEA